MRLENGWGEDAGGRGSHQSKWETQTTSPVEGSLLLLGSHK